jgi:membrane protease YdiL (CAAX protease family)
MIPPQIDDANSGPIEIVHRSPDPRWHLRLRAIVEVLLCSGIPTQLLVAQGLALGGIHPFRADGQLDATWVFVVALVDTVLILALATVLLRANGESPREVFLGVRPVGREVVIGVAVIGPLVLGVAAIILAARALWPSLHNVPDNPLAGLLRSPGDVLLFAVVAMVGGGVREEIQRAFLLTRFERHLGGPTVGLAVTSVAFGAGHALQGWDAAVATFAMGLFWGRIYLQRRSVAAPIVSHAGFNSLEIVRFLLLGPGSV